MEHTAARDKSLENGKLHQVVEGLILGVGSVELEFEQALANLRGLLAQGGFVLVPALDNRARDGVVKRREQRVRVGVEDVEGGLGSFGFGRRTGFVQPRDALAGFAEAFFSVERGLDLREPDLHRGLGFHHLAPWYSREK